MAHILPKHHGPKLADDRIQNSTMFGVLPKPMTTSPVFTNTNVPTWVNGLTRLGVRVGIREFHPYMSHGLNS